MSKGVKPGLVESPWSKPATPAEREALDDELVAAEGGAQVGGITPGLLPRAIHEQGGAGAAAARAPRPQPRTRDGGALVSFTVRIRQSLLDRVYEISHRRRKARAPRDQMSVQAIIDEALAAGLERIE